MAHGRHAGLSLVVGPANAGKVALLLERYLARLDDEPFLIVPNRADVARVRARPARTRRVPARRLDRDLRRPVRADRRRRPRATARRDAGPARPGRRPRRRGLRRRGALRLGALPGVHRRAARRRSPSSRAACSSRSTSTATWLPCSPRIATGLDELGLWDRDLLRRSACERLQGDLGAWHGEPVFAYGFEDLTAAEWSLLEVLAARAEVHVSLPYEPGRAAFASLGADDGRPRRARRRDGSRSCRPGRPSTPPRRSRTSSAGSSSRARRPRSRSAARSAFWRARALRGTLELAADQVLAELRAGTPPEEIGLVLPPSSAGAARWRPCSPGSGSRSRSRRASASRHAARPRAALAAPVRVGGGGPARALRLPSLARTPGSRARASTSPRVGSAAALSKSPGGSRRRPNGCARRRSSPCGSFATPSRRSTECGRSSAR